MDLFATSLHAPLPSSMVASGLQKLTYLKLGLNSLNGTIPSWIFSLPSLEMIILNLNQLTGQLNRYSFSKSLKYITCGYNNLAICMDQFHNNIIDVFPYWL